MACLNPMGLSKQSQRWQYLPCVFGDYKDHKPIMCEEALLKEDDAYDYVN